MPNVENLLAAEGFNFDDMPNILNDFRSFGLEQEEMEPEEVISNKPRSKRFLGDRVKC